MKTLITAIEHWAPEPGALSLRLVKALYIEGKVTKALQSERSKLSIEFGQSPLGKVWADKSPVLLVSELQQDSGFAPLAKQANLAAALALPVLVGDYLISVVVLYMGAQSQHSGALEHWHCNTRDSQDLKLQNGYYTELEHFEFVSKHTSFRQGIGLPGSVWASASPMIIENLAHSRVFVRSQGAEEAGVTTGFALPYLCGADEVNVIAFLSNPHLPFVNQIEIWGKPSDQEPLQFVQGYSHLGLPLSEFYKGRTVQPGEGMLGRAVLTGQAQLSDCAEDFYFSDNASDRDLRFRCKLVFPLMTHGVCQYLVVMYL